MQLWYYNNNNRKRIEERINFFEIVKEKYLLFVRLSTPKTKRIVAKISFELNNNDIFLSTRNQTEPKQFKEHDGASGVG